MPKRPTPRRSRALVGLIPGGVAGEDFQVGGGVEQKEEKVGMFRSDMACGWNVFETAHRIVSTCASNLEPHARIVHVKKSVTSAEHREDRKMCVR